MCLGAGPDDARKHIKYSIVKSWVACCVHLSRTHHPLTVRCLVSRPLLRVAFVTCSYLIVFSSTLDHGHFIRNTFSRKYVSIVKSLYQSQNMGVDQWKHFLSLMQFWNYWYIFTRLSSRYIQQVKISNSKILYFFIRMFRLSLNLLIFSSFKVFCIQGFLFYPEI